MAAEKILNKCPYCGSKLNYVVYKQSEDVYRVKENGELVKYYLTSERSGKMTNILNSEQFNDFITAAHEHNKKLAAERKSKRHKRDVPMPILDYGEYVCPKCNHIQEIYLTDYDDKDHYPKYCYNCGQRLDWTKVKEDRKKERGL